MKQEQKDKKKTTNMGEGLASLRCKSGGDTMIVSACTLLNDSVLPSHCNRFRNQTLGPRERGEDLTPSAAQLSGSEVRSLMGELNCPSMFNAAA